MTPQLTAVPSMLGYAFSLHSLSMRDSRVARLCEPICQVEHVVFVIIGLLQFAIKLRILQVRTELGILYRDSLAADASHCC